MKQRAVWLLPMACLAGLVLLTDAGLEIELPRRPDAAIIGYHRLPAP